MKAFPVLFVFGFFLNPFRPPLAEARTEQVESSKLPAVTQKNLEDAHDSIGKKAYKAASKDVRETATLLKVEVDRSQGEAKTALAKSSAELNAIADGLNKNTVQSERDISDAFARAQHALAVEHHAKAVSAWSDRQGERAAKELRLSADAFENAAQWSGKELSTSTRATLRDVDRATADVADGAKRAGKEVGSAVSKMGSEVKNLGQKLTGKSKT